MHFCSSPAAFLSVSNVASLTMSWYFLGTVAESLCTADSQARTSVRQDIVRKGAA